MFFVLYALIAVALAFLVYMVVAFVCLMTMDTGPDWMPTLMIPLGIVGYVIMMIHITGAYQGWVNSL